MPANKEEHTMNTKCCHHDCAEPGLALVEDGKWLCVGHITEAIHSPEAMALTQADEEMADFIASGSKLS
jgi:hypothetical protein